MSRVGKCERKQQYHENEYRLSVCGISAACVASAERWKRASVEEVRARRHLQQRMRRVSTTFADE